MTSLLFVPGDSPEKFDKAQASGASALIVDLEDSVAPAGKLQARILAVKMLATPRTSQAIWVRVNPDASGLMLQDLVAVVPAKPFGIMLPKCSGRASLLQLTNYLDALEASAGVEHGSTKILAIVTETAASIFAMGEYAGVTDRLWGLAWGAEDLGADVGAMRNSVDGLLTEPFRLARSLCLFAAAAAGVRAIDSVCVALRDAELVLGEAQAANGDGFSGKMAIHPAQIAPINQAFTPSVATLEFAQRVVAAFGDKPGMGTLQLDGRMLDEPHLKIAKRILAQVKSP